MKITAVVLCLLIGVSASAQVRLFRCSIRLSYNVRYQGILYEVTDSTLFYVPNTRQVIRQLRAGEVPKQYMLAADKIEEVEIRRRGYVGRGIGFGAGTGLATGLILGAKYGQQSFLGNWQSFLGALGMATGAVVGAVVSEFPRKTVRIHRDPALFRKAYPEFVPFSYVYQRDHP